MRLLLAYYSSHPQCKAGEGMCGFPVTSWQHPCTVPGGNAPGQVGVPRTEPGCLSSDSPLPATLTSLPQGQGPSRESHCDVCSLMMLECNEVRPPDDQEVVLRKGWWKGRPRLWGWEAGEREHGEAEGPVSGVFGGLDARPGCGGPGAELCWDWRCPDGNRGGEDTVFLGKGDVFGVVFAKLTLLKITRVLLTWATFFAPPPLTPHTHPLPESLEVSAPALKSLGVHTGRPLTAGRQTGRRVEEPGAWRFHLKAC